MSSAATSSSSRFWNPSLVMQESNAQFKDAERLVVQTTIQPKTKRWRTGGASSPPVDAEVRVEVDPILIANSGAPAEEIVPDRLLPCDYCGEFTIKDSRFAVCGKCSISWQELQVEHSQPDPLFLNRKTEALVSSARQRFRSIGSLHSAQRAAHKVRVRTDPEVRAQEDLDDELRSEEPRWLHDSND